MGAKQLTGGRGGTRTGDVGEGGRGERGRATEEENRRETGKGSGEKWPQVVR